MKLNKKTSSECNKDSVKTSGCGCGTKHGSAGEYEEIEETEIKVSK
ncbi:MAG: hypothetical protein IJ218_06665 [Alphaproteobacteria bacterium]|nr:hypothetical protein [Alphaproteobacteria bacterium]